MRVCPGKKHEAADGMLRLAWHEQRFELDHALRAYADDSDRGPRPGAMCCVADGVPWSYFPEHHARRWVGAPTLRVHKDVRERHPPQPPMVSH